MGLKNNKHNVLAPPQYHVKFLEGTDWDAETYLIDMTNTFYSFHVFSLRLFQVCE